MAGASPAPVPLSTPSLLMWCSAGAKHSPAWATRPGWTATVDAAWTSSTSCCSPRWGWSGGHGGMKVVKRVVVDLGQWPWGDGGQGEVGHRVVATGEQWWPWAALTTELVASGMVVPMG